MEGRLACGPLTLCRDARTWGFIEIHRQAEAWRAVARFVLLSDALRI